MGPLATLATGAFLRRLDKIDGNAAVDLAVQTATALARAGHDDATIKSRTTEAIAGNARATNAVSAEAGINSRINIGNVQAAVMWAITVGQVVSALKRGEDLPPGVDPVVLLEQGQIYVTFVLAILGHVIAWIGRNVHGLKPANILKPWTWFGGRRIGN